MCMICVDYNKETMTAEEAFRNLDELIRYGDIEEEHGIQVLAMILKNEMEIIDDDLEVNLEDLFV